jgi:hypothetical protein
MKKQLAALVAAFSLVLFGAMWFIPTASSDNKPLPPAADSDLPAKCGKGYSYKSFAPFSEEVWALKKWDRGKPDDPVLKYMRKMRRCAEPRAHRGPMRGKWLRDKHAYYDHRKIKIEHQLYLEAINPPGSEVLRTIRMCESGGDYSINTGNGFYGAYQFEADTWWSVGGTGLPHEAPPREQDERAALLYRQSGSSPWPVCGV